MPTKPRYLVAGAAAVLITLGAGAAAASALGAKADPAAERRSERVYTDAHRSEAAVSQHRAEQLAQAARPGRVVESHLQTEGEGLRWEVKTADRTRVWEIQVDPSNGTVVGDQLDE